MAKKNQSEELVASLDPGEMLQGGLADDFRGTILEAVYCRWDYDGNIDEPVLAARLTIQPEEGETVTQHWSAGNLDSFVPGTAPGEPCEDEEEVGPYACRVGKRAQLNSNTNFAHLMGSIIDEGEASGHFPRKSLTPRLDCLVGLDAHWNRVPQRKRSGMVQDEGDTRRARDVLVVTEVFGYGNGQPAAKTAKASTKKVAPKADEEDDLDSQLHDALLSVIAEKGKLRKSEVARTVLAAMAGSKSKGAAVKRSAEADFLESGPWNYDAKKGVLTLTEEEED